MVVMEKVNIFDRVIGYFAPGTGLRRAQARQAMGMVRQYDAAVYARGNDGWITPGTGPNVEVGGSLVVLRNRSRQMVRDNAYVARTVEILESSLVGDGIVASFAGNDKADPAADRVIDDVTGLWNAWADSTLCDADGLTNLYGLQALAVRAMVESGEVLIRLRRRSPRQAARLGLGVPLQVQVLEGDFLDHTRNGDAPDGGRIVQGVEFNKWGRRVAYWVFQDHPGEYYLGKMKLSPIRIEAADIIHLFRPTRPGQVRGVPWLHASLKKFRDLDDYHVALLLKAKIEACFAAFVTNEGGRASPLMGETESDGAGNRTEHIEPGIISYLKAGEEVTFAQPGNSDAHTLLSRSFLQAAAVGAGVTYDQISGDLTGANYSSLRAGKIEQRRQVSQRQWSLLIPVMCRPIWQAFAAQAELAGVKGATRLKDEWTPPGHEMIDPAKDVTALLIQVRSGLKTLDQAIREMGYDPRQQVREIGEANKLLDELGLVLDSDPRRTTRTGIVQADQPAGEAPPG